MHMIMLVCFSRFSVLNHRQPHIPSYHFTGVEQLASITSNCTFTDYHPLRVEDILLQIELH